VSALCIAARGSGSGVESMARVLLGMPDTFHPQRDGRSAPRYCMQPLRAVCPERNATASEKGNDLRQLRERAEVRRNISPTTDTLLRSLAAQVLSVGNRTDESS
jgi:hypothetical protein